MVLPASEVHLVASQVNIRVREHAADLLEELAHEVVSGVQDGIDWPVRAGGSGPSVTGREQIFLA